MAIHVRHHTRDKLAFRFIGGLFAILLCAVSVGSLSGIYVHRQNANKIYTSAHEMRTECTEPNEPKVSTKPDIPELPLHTPPQTLFAEVSWDFPPCSEIEVDLQPIELASADAYILLPQADFSENGQESLPRESKVSTHRNASTTNNEYTPPQYKLNPLPIYPKELARKRIKGHVNVRIHINAVGKPTSVEIINSSHPAFSKAAKEKIMSDWLFSPAQSGGSSIAATVITTINFDYSERK